MADQELSTGKSGGHTPEPEIVVKYASTSGTSDFYTISGSRLSPYFIIAEKLQAYWTACCGLTAEQVEAIPKMVQAFVAMREALRGYKALEIAAKHGDDCKPTNEEWEEWDEHVDAALTLADEAAKSGVAT